jgi:bacterioferritin-associated ferredoxin
MFVCVCNGITHRQIEEAIDRGAASLEELTAQLGVAAGCGNCAAFTRQYLSNALQARLGTAAPLGIAA